MLLRQAGKLCHIKSLININKALQQSMSVPPRVYDFEASNAPRRDGFSETLVEITLLLLVEPFVEAYLHRFVSSIGRQTPCSPFEKYRRRQKATDKYFN